MDAVGALALATEPPNDELMKRPPVRRGVSFITKAMWRNIIGHSAYQLAVLAILNVDGKRLLNLSGSDASDVLNTLIFNSFVFCQVCGTSPVLEECSDFLLSLLTFSINVELIPFLGLIIILVSNIYSTLRFKCVILVPNLMELCQYSIFNIW